MSADECLTTLANIYSQAVTNKLITRKEAYGLNKHFESFNISKTPVKKTFPDNIADAQKNIDVSFGELAQDKQKAEDEIKNRIDVPFLLMRSSLTLGSQQDKLQKK